MLDREWTNIVRTNYQRYQKDEEARLGNLARQRNTMRDTLNGQMYEKRKMSICDKDR